jgi:hypothetical protein
LLRGDNDARFVRVAKHLRGFDMAMVETGYRYIELYWAGRDGNWPYAAYQAKKIRTAIANGLERRPKRAPSAKQLEPALRGVEEAIAKRDAASFDQRFAVLTDTCNACHRAEKVAFMVVAAPTQRQSPLRPTETPGAEPKSSGQPKPVPPRSGRVPPVLDEL